MTLTASISTVTLVGGGPTQTVVLGPSGGSVSPENTLSFAAANLPAGVTATFTDNADGTTSLTLTASRTVTAGSGPITITASNASATATVVVSINVAAAPPPPTIDWALVPHFPGMEVMPTGANAVACTSRCGTPGILFNGSCTAVEICNGKDDDCDGRVDNDGVCQLPASLLSMGTRQPFGPRPVIPPAACQLRSGLDPTLFEVDGCTESSGAPGCETFFIGPGANPKISQHDCAAPSCSPGARALCHMPCGSIGSHVCGDNGTWPPCQGVETCNGEDDDCDGSVDNGGVCQPDVPAGLLASLPPPITAPPPPTSCVLPVALQGRPGFFSLPCGTDTFGMQLCQAWFSSSEGTLQAGLCERPPCTPGTTASCTTACGGRGATSCNAQGTWSECLWACLLTGFDGKLDACGSAAGDSPITEYAWDVQLPDRPPFHFTSASCQTDFVFPSEDPYPVTLTVTTQNGGTNLAKGIIQVKNRVIVSMGDSLASGEGNPDVPRPSFNDSPARWDNQRCHRSLSSFHALTARQLEVDDPHSTVTFLPLACSGAATHDLLNPYVGVQRTARTNPRN